ncbi:MAG: Hcp family type VI secretion system effector [Panacagrimonas sp.]
MALDMFLTLDGVKGESQDADSKFKEQIDILAWSWGMSNSGTFHQGGGGGAGKANVQDISVTKYVDKSSDDIHLACLNGKHYKEATISVRKAGEKPYEYITILMTKVLITSVSTGGSGGEDRLTENISLNFAKVAFNYNQQNEKGGVVKAGEYTFDIAGNAKV